MKSQIESGFKTTFIATSDWPFGSRDLNPLDYELWNTLEEMAYRKRLKNLQSLRKSITQAAVEISLETFVEEQIIPESGCLSSGHLVLRYIHTHALAASVTIQLQLLSTTTHNSNNNKKTTALSENHNSSSRHGRTKQPVVSSTIIISVKAIAKQQPTHTAATSWRCSVYGMDDEDQGWRTTSVSMMVVVVMQVAAPLKSRTKIKAKAPGRRCLRRCRVGNTIVNWAPLQDIVT
ncbi:uncharacterized protein LOC108736728 [Agrilus planipennis]|uniref:Uncharacterized protein LOC108736728 n=1 Tax=Agrilus planipennis TaxID=224129 RepID=A0A1W4WLJ4_AGRPL|nr:uncharacterized protein LOC108736728 [Agrilus planipennis]